MSKQPTHKLSMNSLGEAKYRNIHEKRNKLTSSVYDCTVEDVEYIYNKLSI